MLRYFGSVTYLCKPPLGRWGDILSAFDLNTSLDSTLVLIKRTPKNSQEHDTCSSLMDTNLLPSFRAAFDLTTLVLGRVDDRHAPCM